MPTRKKAIRISHALYEATGIRAKQLGYKNWCEWAKGAFRRDVSKLLPHKAMEELSGEPREVQDAFDALLLRRLRQAPGAV